MDQNHRTSRKRVLVLSSPQKSHVETVYVQEMPQNGDNYVYIEIVDNSQQSQDLPDPDQHHIVDSTDSQSPSPITQNRSTQNGAVSQSTYSPRSISDEEEVSEVYVQYLPPTRQREAPLTLDAWTQTPPDLFQTSPISISRDIEHLRQQIRSRLPVTRRLNYQEDNESITSSHSQEVTSSTNNRILANSIEADASGIEMQYTLNVATNEAECKYHEQEEHAAQIEAEVRAKAHIKADTTSDFDEQILVRVKQEIIKIANGIIASGNGGTIVHDDDPNEPLTQIGPYGTKIKTKDFEKIDWSKAPCATRTLLMLLFKRETLATHSMSGKASPAFKNHPIKRQLDPKIIRDIEYIVTTRCNVPRKDVRGTITTKCADENKMLKLRHIALLKGNLYNTDDADKENAHHRDDRPTSSSKANSRRWYLGENQKNDPEGKKKEN